MVVTVTPMIKENRKSRRMKEMMMVMRMTQRTAGQEVQTPSREQVLPLEEEGGPRLKRLKVGLQPSEIRRWGFCRMVA
jgi:hypothetical protein